MTIQIHAKLYKVDFIAQVPPETVSRREKNQKILSLENLQWFARFHLLLRVP